MCHLVLFVFSRSIVCDNGYFARIVFAMSPKQRLLSVQLVFLLNGIGFQIFVNYNALDFDHSKDLDFKCA